MTRVCSDCPKPISKGSKGRCQKCANTIHNRSPEMRAAAAAGMLAKRSDPNFKQDRSGHAEKLRQHYADPANRARILATGAKGRAARIAAVAVPERYADLMRELKAKRLPRGETRRLLNEQIRADAVRDHYRFLAEQKARHERQIAQAY